VPGGPRAPAGGHGLLCDSLRGSRDRRSGGGALQAAVPPGKEARRGSARWGRIPGGRLGSWVLGGCLTWSSAPCPWRTPAEQAERRGERKRQREEENGEGSSGARLWRSRAFGSAWHWGRTRIGQLRPCGNGGSAPWCMASTKTNCRARGERRS